MPGPAKQPTSLTLVKGNPGKRAINRGEPEADYLDDLTAPSHLPAPVAEVWNELAPKLRKSRLLTVLDVHALEMTCAAIANHRAATAMLAHEHSADGHKIATLALVARNAPSPWLIVQSMATKAAFVGLSRFGLTPADRARVTVNPQADLFGNDPAAAYFR